MGETAESFSAPRDDISLRIFGCFQGTDLMGSVHWWIKQANGQRDTRGVIFLWRRGAWTIQLIFGHSHIWSGHKGPPGWNLPKRSVGRSRSSLVSKVISNKWIFQITDCHPPLLHQMTNKADARTHLTCEWQYGSNNSQKQTNLSQRKEISHFNLGYKGIVRYSNQLWTEDLLKI